MDISIIISGNLTGFSRFYASPNANDIYNEAKFDFDYRNFLTFINAGEKAYAISFSPKVIAVSLVTRILDSFRRPGILVVTALVPRYQLVSGTLNAQDKSAIYRLLNEINDKFYEKNFLNGMVNQNPAVLMQDYYSDILRNYALVSDRMQKAINTTIEVNSPNKRIGYVSANEKDMPKYLSSLLRKSYNGYHHIFFADKAPQNIDEPAEEIVTYRVRIENGNRNVSGEVRLADKIPTVTPEQGERPLSNTNFTYGQVLNGEAGSDIIATIENDTIVLTFRFPKEEKTIHFKFYEGTNEIPAHVVRPSLVDSNGSSYPLSTDSWTFIGKEIYGGKTLKSGNNEFTVENSFLDISRMQNDDTLRIYVRRGWNWNFDPVVNGRRMPIKPVTITLRNRYTGAQEVLHNVTRATSRVLSGTSQEWDIQIDSDYYKSITGPANTPFRLEPKLSSSTNAGNNDITQPHKVQRGGNSARTHGNTGQSIKLTKGENDSAKEQARIEAEKKKCLIQYGIYAIVAIICCAGGWWGYSVWSKDKDKDGDITPDSKWVTKNVIFSLEDGSANQSKIEAENLALLDVIVTSNSVKIEDGKNAYSKSITFDPKNSTDSIFLVVSFNKAKEETPIIFASKKYAVNKLREGSKSVVLSVKNSELDSYRSLVARTIPSDLAAQVERLSAGDKYMRAYANLLDNLRGDIAPDVETITGTDANGKSRQKPITDVNADADKSINDQKNRFGDTSLRLGEDKNGEDKEAFYSGNNKIEPKAHEEARASDLRYVMQTLSAGEIPSKTPSSLAEEQKAIIDKLRNLFKNDNVKLGKLRSALRDKKKAGSLHRIKVNILDNEKEYLD